MICASHYGKDIHKKVMNRTLKKIRLKIEDLLCCDTYSLKEKYRTVHVEDHVELTPANSDCSGKHGGMPAACLSKGYNIEDYNLQDYPVQKDIKEIVSNFCEIEENIFHVLFLFNFVFFSR